MINFGQLKNNIEILKKYLTKMNIITECQVKPQWIQQKFLRQNNPNIFLQLFHYILIKFSPFTLFVKVLDYYPTIKDDSDKKFINNVMILSRKMFQIDVKIDLEQFFSSKFLQKKTQLLSYFSKAAYQFHIKQNKPTNTISSSFQIIKKKQNKLTQYLPQKLQKKYKDEDDQDQQIPRNLNFVPSSRQNVILSLNKHEHSSSDEDLKELINNKNKLKQKTASKHSNHNFQEQKNVQIQKTHPKNKNIYSKNNLMQRLNANNYDQDQKSPPIQITDKIKNNIYSKEYNKPVEKTKKNKRFNVQQQLTHSNIHENNQIDLSNYISRQQFMDIIISMSKNFTELLDKFNQFQGQIGGWVQNVNAKISILQQNVKTIKNNL